MEILNTKYPQVKVPTVTTQVDSFLERKQGERGAEVDQPKTRAS